MPRILDEFVCSFKNIAWRAKSLELETLRPIVETILSGVSCNVDSISVSDSLDVVFVIDADALIVSVGNLLFVSLPVVDDTCTGEVSVTGEREDSSVAAVDVDDGALVTLRDTVVCNDDGDTGGIGVDCEEEINTGTGLNVDDDDRRNGRRFDDRVFDRLPFLLVVADGE